MIVMTPRGRKASIAFEIMESASDWPAIVTPRRVPNLSSHISPEGAP